MRTEYIALHNQTGKDRYKTKDKTKERHVLILGRSH